MDGIPSERTLTLSMMRNLILQRGKIARHWLGRMASLDFFSAQVGALRFQDLAVDVGRAGARAYDVGSS